MPGEAGSAEVRGLALQVEGGQGNSAFNIDLHLQADDGLSLAFP